MKLHAYLLLGYIPATILAFYIGNYVGHKEQAAENAIEAVKAQETARAEQNKLTRKINELTDVSNMEITQEKIKYEQLKTTLQAQKQAVKRDSTDRAMDCPDNPVLSDANVVLWDEASYNKALPGIGSSIFLFGETYAVTIPYRIY